MDIPEEASYRATETILTNFTFEYPSAVEGAVKLALEAAAPWIVAQALRGLSKRLAEEPYENFTYHPHSIDGLREMALVSGGIDSAAAWLTARADDLEEA